MRYSTIKIIYSEKTGEYKSPILTISKATNKILKSNTRMKRSYLFHFLFKEICRFVLAPTKTDRRMAIKNILQVKIWSLVLIVLMLTKAGICQSEKPFTPPSPQSQEFIKYGDYPVGYFTGIPDISIPLHQVDFYGYKFPLTLKYHPSGIKAGGHVDPSGLGWTLFCGGEISRTVHNVPDESADFKKGIQANPLDGMYYKYVKNLADGYADGSMAGDLSYDEFNVTLPDGTFFKFYIQNDNNGGYKIYTNPAPLPVKITFEYLSHPGPWAYINSFTIIDEQGIKYYFANTEHATGKYGSTFTTSWKLTEITLPNTDKTIRFTYKSTNDVIIPKKGYSRLIRDSVGQISCVVCLGCPFGKYVGSVPKGNKTSWVVNDYSQDNLNFSLGVLIPESIFFGDHSIDFSYDEVRPGGGSFMCHKLNNIALNDVNKKVFFNMSSVDGFGAITKLDSLRIQGQQQNLPLTYKFDYTTHAINAGLAGPWPAYDHWGFLLPIWVNVLDRNEVSNNCTGFGSMATYNLPNFDVDVAWPVNPTDECLFETWTGTDLKPRYRTKLGNANREPYAVPELTLNRIDYPTGGYTLFEYESNKFKSSEFSTANQILSAGGYRIKTISSYTNGTLSERKTYKYGVNESGYGYAPVEPSAKAYQRTYIDWDNIPDTGGFGSNVRFRERSFSSDNFASLLGSLPPVMYDEVAEYIGDENGNIGKTIYKYNIMKRLPPEEGGYGADHLQINPVTGDMYVLQDELWKYGQLGAKEVYRNENSAYTLKQKLEQHWDYPSGGTRLDDRSGFYMYDRAIISSTPTNQAQESYRECFKPNVFQSTPHYILTGKAALTESITTNYTDQSNPLTVRETYNYDTYGHLSDKTTVNSNATVYRTAYKYPYDRNSNDFLNESLNTANTDALDALVSKNIVAPVIQESHYFGQNAVTTKRTDYLLFGGKPFPQSIKSKNDAFAIEENITYAQYDNYGNPLQYKGRDGITTGLLWGYNGQYLVAKVAGADYATASSKITQSVLDAPSDDQALRNALNNLRTIPNTLVTTYTYLPSIGMTSATDPGGHTTYYEYDGFNRLSIVRDQDKNILKKICYNYAGQPESCMETAPPVQIFWNDEQSGSFTRSDCDPGYTGSSVTYTVPAHTYSSIISKDDANAIAQTDIANNGPNYANANGTCENQQGESVSVIAVSSAPSYCYQVEFYNITTGFDLWCEIENGGSTLATLPPGVYNINFNASGSSCPWGAIRTYSIYYDGNSTSTTTSPSSNGYAHFNIPINQSCQIFIQ